MTILLSLLLAIAPANAACGPTPCGTAVTAPAPQASAEGATHLAAAAYSKALRLEHSAKTKADKAEVAELRRELKRYSEMSASQAARHAKQIRALAARVDSLDARLRKVEARQVALVVGAGVDVRIGPAIADVYYGTTIPYGRIEAGIMSQDRHWGWALTADGVYNPGVASPGFGAHLDVFAPRSFGIPRTALGVNVGFSDVVYGQRSGYEAYKAVFEAGPYARFTIGKKGSDNLATFLVVRPDFYVGSAATTSDQALEWGGTVNATFAVAKFLE